MTIDDLVYPRGDIGPLTWLGQNNWVRFERREGPVIVALADQTLLYQIRPAEVRRYGPGFATRVAALLLHTGTSVPEFVSRFVLSKLLAGGPKVFRPTADQCRAMEHTDANIRFEDYRQPYPAMVIEWPGDYRQEMAAKLGREFPRFTAACHEPEFRSVLTDSIWAHPHHAASILTEYSLAPDGSDPDAAAYAGVGHCELVYRTLEESLRGSLTDFASPNAPAIRLAQRLAVNFNLMMLTFGHREARPGGVPDARRTARHSSDRDNDLPTGGREPRAEVRVVEFEQEVRLFDTNERAEQGGGSGPHTTPAPHWRRGHLRRQHYGARNASVRFVFIRPVLVRRSAFSGDPSDTTASYQL